MNDLIEKARAFAIARHAGQFRKDAARNPYISHPAEVADLVSEFGGRSEAVAAGWLHDTVEDCPPTSLAEITVDFGPSVAAIVAELTDDKTLPKAERKRLQIAGAAAKSADAALVKLCDKISNVRSVGATPPRYWSMARRLAYLDWAETVVAGLNGLSDAALARFRQVTRTSREQIGSGRRKVDTGA